MASVNPENDPLSPEMREALIQAKPTLYQYMKIPPNFIDLLRAYGMLRDLEVEDVKSKPTDHAKIGHIIDILCKGQVKHYDALVKVLQETGQKHVIKHLEGKHYLRIVGLTAHIKYL